MTHAEFAELVAACGGEFVEAPIRGAVLVVVGQDGWPLRADGRPTQNLEKARQLRALGYPIELVTEEDFLDRLGLVDRQESIHRRYTVWQLSRILGVPGSRIRAWVRAGLIEPVETVHRLAYFDFSQAASAKTVFELATSGVTPQRIRESLEQLRTWLPHVDKPLSQLAILEHDGRLLVRLQAGSLAEPSGQLRLDFDGASGAGPVPMVQAKSADEWFAEAIACEDEGRMAEAAEAYREVLRLEPDDPVVHFNLGNVLYALGGVKGSAAEFRQALRCDPAYVEAWNNLGSVLAELDRPAEAIESFQRALGLVPTYADAHYNLADTLSLLGRAAEARSHWRQYLRYDPTGPWADEVRRRLT